MYKKAKPFFIIVRTPLHVGSGQDLGIVDMPIQRERHTGFPKIEASGLKGSIREVFEEYLIENQVQEDENEKIIYELHPSFQETLKKKFGDRLFYSLKQEWKVENKNKREIHYIKFNEAISLSFGPEEGDAHAGALGFTDARLLLFPVKSMKGVFAWITCPMVLERFKNELLICEKSDSIKNFFFKSENIPNGNTISNLEKLGVSGKIILEEYTFDVKEENTTKHFAKWLADLLGIKEIEDKLVVLSDDDFKDFVNLSTEVITRTKIDPKTGTVKSGALFTEEYLPAETVLYSLALASPVFNKEKGIFKSNNSVKEEDLIMEFFEKGIPDVIQVGGNATLGKGIVRIKKWQEVNNG